MITKQEFSQKLLEKLKGKNLEGMSKIFGKCQLKTKEKNIISAINEIVDYRNDLKKSTIQKIKNKGIEIDENAEWSEILRVILQNKRGDI